MANFAGPEQILRGIQTVTTGTSANLDYPADAFSPSMSRGRKPPVQTITRSHQDSLDDVWNGFFPQVGSHLDGLRHRRATSLGFYNGTPDDEVSEGTSPIGVQHWAQRPLASRGILADLSAFRQSTGTPIDHEAGEHLKLSDLTNCLQHQGTQIQDGDFLLVHTGWAAWFLNESRQRREELRVARRTTGFTQSTELLEWLWDHRIALLATDTFAVEALPARPDSPFAETAGEDHGMMHQELIAKLGCPLGELWKLDELARESAEDGIYESLVTVKPLNLPGAVGSPANAMAIR
jgi:kynurenine formamidase